MKARKVIVPVIILLAVGTAVGLWWRRQTAEFRYSGTIEATKVDVPSRLPSVITRMLVKEGDLVEKGQLLAELDCEDLRIQGTLLAHNYERGRKLAKIGSMPQDNFEQVKAKHDELQLKLSWCSITAPIKGRVLNRYHEEGEWVAPGAKLLTLADLDDVWAYVYVPQTLLAQLPLGLKVPGYLPELDMKQIDGSLIKINEEAEFTPKNVQTREERTRLVFGVKLRFPNEQGLLKPGMPIEVDLPDDGHE
ncbi:HlyD family secretion protein [Oligoflexus tunisiensis]|uniref:HlyD family secretion protein n=1 Tax=Oligoflexus tunisiensis TaxID=708132 RepID=UPI00114CAFBD|nr:efflux RND transporter periplasmic adaptor subunit [Oligoflexus tunisiensis]